MPRVGYRHDRDELLAGAVDAALDGGLAELTFGRLASRLGVTDRMLVYYFTTKDALLQAVLSELAGRLLARLDQAFGPSRADAATLAGRAWPLLTDTEADRIFAVWFELAGHAAAGHEPHRALAQDLLAAWFEWASTKVEGRTAAARQREAARLLAIVDGALLLHHLGQRDAAQVAIRALGR